MLSEIGKQVDLIIINQQDLTTKRFEV
jgi:hypothetical protein